MNGLIDADGNIVPLAMDFGERFGLPGRLQIFGRRYDGSWKEVRDVSTWIDADWRIVDRHLTRPRKRMLRRERMARKRRRGWA